MNIVLWLLQLSLAAIFAAHGWLLISPPPELLPIINESMGVGFRLFLGVAEVAGAIGIVLPALTRIQPWLTELTAACFAFVAASATVSHLLRDEMSSAGITVVLFLVSSLVAYARWRVRPIESRQAGRLTGTREEPRLPAAASR